MFGFYPESIGRIIKGTKVDIIALINTFKAYRQGIIYVVVFFALIFFLIALVTPKTYKSSALILTQSDEATSLSKLGGLASLGGVDLSSMLESPTTIKPEVYPHILMSYTFLNQLANTKFREMDSQDSTRLYEIVLNAKKKEYAGKIKMYTVKLPWTLKNMIFKTPSVVFTGNAPSLIVLSEEDEEVYDRIMNSMDISVDRVTNLVQLSVVLNNPYLSAQVAQKSLELLQEMVIGFKTKQVKDNLDYITERFEEQKTKYDSIRERVNKFKDAHRNIVIERSDGELEDLNMKYNLISGVYTMLAQQLEQARLAVRKETPVFSVIEPVKVPVRKHGPNYGMHVLLGALLGFIVSVLIVIFKIVWFNITEADLT